MKENIYEVNNAKIYKVMDENMLLHGGSMVFTYPSKQVIIGKKNVNKHLERLIGIFKIKTLDVQSILSLILLEDCIRITGTKDVDVVSPVWATVGFKTTTYAVAEDEKSKIWVTQIVDEGRKVYAYEGVKFLPTLNKDLIWFNRVVATKEELAEVLCKVGINKKSIPLVLAHL